MDGLAARMPSSLLARWEAFHSLCPFGSAIEDQRHGTVAAMVANMAGKRLKKGKDLKPSDVFPSRIPAKRPSRTALRAKIRALAGGGAPARRARKAKP